MGNLPFAPQGGPAALAEARRLAAPHFDLDHYLAQRPELAPAGGDALLHFLVWGWRQGLDPSPGFSVAGYLAANADVAAAGLNPLLHYLSWGMAEGRSTPRACGPEMTAAALDDARALTAGHFDPDHYRAQRPAVAATDPLVHFLEAGWRQCLDPSPDFDVGYYLAGNADVAALGINPLLHYLRWGAWEGRRPCPPPAEPVSALTPGLRGSRPVRPTPAQLAEARTLAGPLFDEAHYRAQGPDLAAADGDPLLHFLVWGWRAGLDPSPGFDVRGYCADTPDLAGTALNPLIHFLRHGRREDDLPAAAAWRRTLDAARPPRERAAQDGRPAAAPTLGAVALRAALAEAAGPCGLALAVSHDDYAVSRGGVQNLLGDEQAAMHGVGWGYLHLSPARPMLMLADPAPPAETVLHFRLNGRRLGTACMADVIAAVTGLAAGGEHLRVILHHLAGHVPEHIAALAEAAGDGRPLAWVHDGFTLCPSYALMRNDIAWCGAPPPDSAACTVCCYGEERPGHLARLRALFARLRPVVLAPSDTALALWQRIGLAHAGTTVAPLLRLQLGPAVPRPPGRPVRIAHLGARSLVKGWPVFAALAERHAGDPRYEFLQLGLPGGLPAPPQIRTRRVEVTAADRGAMLRAVAEQGIDAVLLWSQAYETFSYTAHEALAGGAFVLARVGAGNVWPAVRAAAPDQGRALETEQELHALFAGEDLAALLAQPRRAGSILPGRGSLDWLEEEEAHRG